MDSKALSTATQICNICTKVPWLDLNFEDLEAYAHHSSLNALAASAQTCLLCKFVLHAAVSNYRRSLKLPGDKYRWRRYETVYTHTYVKEFGQCMPTQESDIGSNPCGFITPIDMGDWGYENLSGGPIFAAIAGKRNNSNEEPVEDALLDLAELEKQIPSGHSIWLYGNYWSPEGHGSGDKSELCLVGIGARFGSTNHIFHSVNNPNQSVLIRGSALSIIADDENPPSHVSRRMRNINSDSDPAFRQLKRWLHECDSTHECSSSFLNSALPTRVLQILASDGSVALVETRGQRGKYVALSHSWGRSPRLMATKSNLDDLKHGIDLSTLPKTFQDAIRVTKVLGIRYLWIDCLCIIQDDPLDWERESSTMGDVYLNCYITISAVNSTDSNSGCFPKRNEGSYISPATVSLGYKTKIQESGPDSCSLELMVEQRPTTIHLTKEWLPGSCSIRAQKAAIGTFGKQYDPVSDEPLSSRGWTLQERLLSQRTIHYGKDQMYFECESMLQSEDGFQFPSPFSLDRLLWTQTVTDHSAPDGHGNGGVNLAIGCTDIKGGIRWEGGWISLIQNYSMRKLTVAHDKLPALSGLVRIISERTQDRYFAGLWGKHFCEDLFWRVYLQEESFSDGIPLKGDILGEATTPAEYRAPSWSWASLDAPIRFIPLTYGDLVATVIDCETTPSGSDMYGRVKTGKLVIEGPLLEIRPHKPREEWKQHGIPVEIHFEDSERPDSIGAVYLDLPSRPLQFPCYALFIDPANALILSAYPTSATALGKFPGDNLTRLPLFTSEDARIHIQGLPKVIGRNYAVDFKLETFANIKRVGIASFVKGFEPDPKKVGETGLSPEQSRSKSWGPITKEDLRVRVTII